MDKWLEKFVETGDTEGGECLGIEKLPHVLSVMKIVNVTSLIIITMKTKTMKKRILPAEMLFQ